VGREALDFIDTLNLLASTDAVLACMRRSMARHGFEMLLFMGLPVLGRRLGCTPRSKITL
jgi:hypothetical protein